MDINGINLRDVHVHEPTFGIVVFDLFDEVSVSVNKFITVQK